LSEDQELSDAVALWPEKASRSLGDLADVFRGPIFKRAYVEDSRYGVPYVSASDMDRTDYWGTRLLSTSHGDLLEHLALRKNMAVVTCSGMNLGWSMPVRSDMDGVIGSHDLIRVIAKDAREQGFIAAFLASRLGWVAIRQSISGGSVKHVEPDDLNRIKVLWPSEAIRRNHGKAFLCAADLRAESNVLIGQATQAVFAANGIRDQDEGDWFQQGRELGFTAPVSSHSLRGWNYSRKAHALRQLVEGTGSKPLGEWVRAGVVRKGPSFKRIEASGEHAVPLIGQRQLFRFRPRPKMIARSVLPRDPFCSPGTTLIASRGTFGESEVFGRAQYVSDITSQWMFSNDILRVVPANDDHAGWLYAFLRSRTAFRLIRSVATGSKQQDLHPGSVPLLPVLQGSDDDYRKVNRLVEKAFRLRDEAYRLEHDSMAELERMVKEAI
jgi:type I restriction enzyme S subunit